MDQNGLGVFELLFTGMHRRTDHYCFASLLFQVSSLGENGVGCLLFPAWMTCPAGRFPHSLADIDVDELIEGDVGD